MFADFYKYLLAKKASLGFESENKFSFCLLSNQLKLKAIFLLPKDRQDLNHLNALTLI